MIIPHPSSVEVLVSLEMLLLLYIPKKVIDIFVDKEARVLRKRLKTARQQRRDLIRYHIQEAHIGKFNVCHECLASNLENHRLERQAQS